MDLTVQTFWVVYIVILIVLAVILFAISRKGGVKLSIGIFLAALLAAVFTYVLIWFGFDSGNLTPDEEQMLWLLYCVMAIIVALSLFWMLFDVIGKGGHSWTSKRSVKCDDKKCEVKEEDNGGRKTKFSVPRDSVEFEGDVEVDCDDYGCDITNHHTGLTSARKGSLNINYLE